MHFTWAPVNEALNGLKIYDSQKEKKYLSQYNHFSYFDVAKVGNSFAIEDALCIKKRKAIASSSMTHSTLIRSKLFGVNHVLFDDVNPCYSIQKLTSFSHVWFLGLCFESRDERNVCSEKESAFYFFERNGAKLIKDPYVWEIFAI